MFNPRTRTFLVSPQGEVRVQEIKDPVKAWQQEQIKKLQERLAKYGVKTQ
jgi:hypothetical protein